jgi:endonuclease III
MTLWLTSLDIDSKAEALAKYIDTLSDFSWVEPEIPYYHMGATIADAILQSGLNYKTVVEPRVRAILRKYPEAKTTSNFLELLNRIDPKLVLNWKDSEKPNRILQVVHLLIEEGIETENQLKVWLEKETNIAKLDSVRGIGNKTIDYFRILSGTSTSAIDRHLLNFLNKASINVNDYREAKEVIDRTADLVRKDWSLLDHSIWNYMSRRKKSRNGSSSNC